MSRRIEMKKIDDISKRRVTFTRRRGGLFKQAHELSVLCDVDVGIIVFSTTNRLYEFSTSSMRGIIDRYNGSTTTEPSSPQMQMQDDQMMSGSRRTEIKKIDDISERKVAFSNRRRWLFKRAYELSVLCDAEVGIIIFSTTNRLYDFSTSSMRGIIDRYNRTTTTTTQPSSSQMQMQDEMRQEHEAIDQEQLRNQVLTLKAENERLMGNNLEGLSVPQLQQLEKQLTHALISIKQNKDGMLFEEIDSSNRKNDELDHENEVLRGEIEKLKRLIPSSSSDTTWYYGCNNRHLETAQLLMRLHRGDYSRKKAPPRSEHDSTSCENDKI